MWIPATGTTTWNLTFAATNFPADGSYNLRTRSIDRAGNTSATQTRTFTITRFAPSALTLFNGDRIVTQTIDEVRITFSEAPNLSSIYSTWSGTGNQSLGGFVLVVTITDNGGNDTLSMTSTACTLNIGTIQTGRNYVNTTSTFRGVAPFDSRVTWTASSRLLTIHLGAIVAGSLNSSPQTAGTVVYTPHSAITDVVGTPIVTTPFSSASDESGRHWVGLCLTDCSAVEDNALLGLDALFWTLARHRDLAVHRGAPQVEGLRRPDLRGLDHRHRSGDPDRNEDNGADCRPCVLSADVAPSFPPGSSRRLSCLEYLPGRHVAVRALCKDGWIPQLAKTPGRCT